MGWGARQCHTPTSRRLGSRSESRSFHSKERNRHRMLGFVSFFLFFFVVGFHQQTCYILPGDIRRRLLTRTVPKNLAATQAPEWQGQGSAQHVRASSCACSARCVLHLDFTGAVSWRLRRLRWHSSAHAKRARRLEVPTSCATCVPREKQAVALLCTRGRGAGRVLANQKPDTSAGSSVSRGPTGENPGGPPAPFLRRHGARGQGDAAPGRGGKQKTERFVDQLAASQGVVGFLVQLVVAIPIC